MAPRKRFLLRIDERLYAALERWAAQDLRSVNGQIEYLLTEAVRRNGKLGREAEAPTGGPDSEDGDAQEDRPGDRSSSERAGSERAAEEGTLGESVSGEEPASGRERGRGITST